MEMEVRRMGFDTQNAWRVSDINSNYKYAKESRPVMSVSEGQRHSTHKNTCIGTE